MIRMYPKAVVLTARHPFGGTEMMAQSLAFALNANGYDARPICIDDQSLQSLGPLLQDPDLQLLMTTGTLPLSIRVDGRPVWDVMPAGARFVTYVIDAWPYDHVRVAPMREYQEAWRTRRELHIASVEGHDARLIGPRAIHMPAGAYPAPWRIGPKQHPDRLMMWASAHKELAVSPLHDAFEDTLRDNNPWGLDPARIRQVGEALRSTTIVHGSTAVAEALRIPVDQLLTPPWMTAVCAMDSCLKRYRRVKVVRALRQFPLDIYGQNWERYVADAPSVRQLTPDPNHNHVFSYVCQHYAGLVNIDPNYANGTNERAVSALAMGIPVANNFNLMSDGLPGVYTYHFSDESIRCAAERVLSHAAPVPTPMINTWEYQVGCLLRKMAQQSEGAMA